MEKREGKNDMENSMKCQKCGEEWERRYFLPFPGRIERCEKCVFCMRDHYLAVAGFLQKAAAFPAPDLYIESAGTPLREAAFSITCVEKNLPSLDSLKAQAREIYMRLAQQIREKECLILGFKCAGDLNCAFEARAKGKKNNEFTLQILRPHTCPRQERTLASKLREEKAFIRFSAKMQRCLSPQQIEEVKKWPVQYLEVSAMYKKLQEQVHRAEDRAIAEVWEGECRWRRARGKTNAPPVKDDLDRLAQIARQRNCNEEVLEYIHADFCTEPESTYYQQRGYFLLLTFASQEMLSLILARRVQVMMYTSNLLDNDLSLFCHKRLNCTVLRNHALMALLLLYARRAKQGLSPHPMLGFTFPKDSDVLDFYDILDNLDDKIFTAM